MSKWVQHPTDVWRGGPLLLGPTSLLFPNLSSVAAFVAVLLGHRPVLIDELTISKQISDFIFQTRLLSRVV
jgi:hypothetical protein